MHKYFLNIVIVIAATLILTSGCTADPEKNATPAVSEDLVKSEKCVLTPSKEPVACTMQYDPVCGCNGKTYGNACMARGAGVPRSTPGACGDEHPNN